jgi:hypothetical protein
MCGYQRLGMDLVLTQLIKFLVVKLSNHRFNMCIVFMTNYFLIESDISDDNEALLVTEFINLKIKSV